MRMSRRCQQLQVEYIDPQLIHERVHNHDQPTITYPDQLMDCVFYVARGAASSTTGGSFNKYDSSVIAPARAVQQQVFAPAGLGTRAHHKRVAEEQLTNTSKTAQRAG